MPYLLYADVLGARELLTEDFDEASRVLSDLIMGSLRGESKLRSASPDGDSQSKRSRGFIINDSVFYFAETLRQVVEFSSGLAQHMLGGGLNHQPYGLRGSIVRAANWPEFQQGDEQNFWVFQVWARELRAATQAETAKVQGARIIIQADALAEERPESWPVPVRPNVAGIRARSGSLLTLPAEFEGYGADVLWMNAPSTTTFRLIGSRSQEYGTRLANAGTRPAMHGAATQALYGATARFRDQVAGYLKITAEAVGMQGPDPTPERDEFEGLLLQSEEVSRRLALNGHGQNLPTEILA